MYIWSSITVHFTSSPYECSFGNFCHAFSVMCHPMEKKKKAQDSNLETHMWILFCYDLGNLSALVSRSVNGLASFSLSSQVSVCPVQERLWGWGNNVTPCLSRAYKSSQSVWRQHWSAHADCHACHCMWLWGGSVTTPCNSRVTKIEEEMTWLEVQWMIVDKLQMGGGLGTSWLKSCLNFLVLFCLPTDITTVLRYLRTDWLGSLDGWRKRNFLNDSK